MDGAGNLYIADSNNHRIRKVEAAVSSGTLPTLTIADTTLDASSGRISVPVEFTSNGHEIGSIGTHVVPVARELM